MYDFNQYNSLISVTDLNGNVISWASSGSCGFKGARKRTPFASKIATINAIKKGLDRGLRYVEIHIRGAGRGRDSAIRSVQMSGLGITVIKDVTPLPHNGCRPPKKRRI